MRPLRMFFKSLENHNFNMPLKSNEVEMVNNACSYFVSSLVPTKLVLRLHRCLLLAANFGQFVKQGCRDGAVVRALASHQCGPGSIPRSCDKYGLSLLVLFSVPTGFPRLLRFPLSPRSKI